MAIDYNAIEEMTEKQKLERLIEVLREIESSKEITKVIPDEIMGEDGSYSPSDLPELVQEAEYLANHVLFDKVGQCAWGNHRKLKTAGFNVTAGESDSFGWVTGVIHTTKGRIVYG